MITPFFSEFDTLKDYEEYKEKCNDESTFPKIEFPHLTKIANNGEPYVLNESKMFPFVEEKPEKINDYLYSVTYEHVSYNYAKEHAERGEGLSIGACSSVRKGNFYGRNFDWTYDKAVAFVVKTVANDGRFATIGMSGALTGLSTDLFIPDNEGNDYKAVYSSLYNVLPCVLLDGVNERGVFCNHNIVPFIDQRPKDDSEQGWGKASDEKETISAMMLPRYILDNFATAEEACEYIKKYVTVKPVTLNGIKFGSHFMIGNVGSEKTPATTYIMEFNGSTVITKCEEDSKVYNTPIMTNFNFLGTSDEGFTVNENGLIEKGDNCIATSGSMLTSHAEGVERYNKATSLYDSIQTADDMWDLMTSALKFTNAYKNSTSPYWHSEMLGQYEDGGDLSITTPFDNPLYKHVIGIMQNWYKDRSRNDTEHERITWQTVHTSVYDFGNNKLKVLCQEGNDGCDTPYEISLFE